MSCATVVPRPPQPTRATRTRSSAPRTLPADRAVAEAAAPRMNWRRRTAVPSGIRAGRPAGDPPVRLRGRAGGGQRKPDRRSAALPPEVLGGRCDRDFLTLFTFSFPKIDPGV